MQTKTKLIMAGLDRMHVHSHFCELRTTKLASLRRQRRTTEPAASIDSMFELGWTAARPGGRRPVLTTPGHGQAGPSRASKPSCAGPRRAKPSRAGPGQTAAQLGAAQPGLAQPSPARGSCTTTTRR